MTSVMDSTLPPPTGTQSIFTLRKVVLADREVTNSLVGESLSPLVRVGGMEVRLFIFPGQTPQYQLILTNLNGRLIWFGGLVTSPTYGWYTLTNVVSQRSVIDRIMQEPHLSECIKELMCTIPEVNDPQVPNALPQIYMGSGSAMERKPYGKAYCGDDLRHKVNKWV